MHEAPKPYDPKISLKERERINGVLKLPQKKELPLPITICTNALKIGERSLGNILQKIEKKADLPQVDCEEESVPEEYDGKIRSGNIIFIGEKSVRQAHDSDYSEYNIKDFKTDDLPKLLSAMLQHRTVGFLWNKLENHFEFFIAEPPQNTA